MKDSAQEQPLTFNVEADALAALGEAVSKEQTRYYLNGVFLQPWKTKGGKEGVMMVATDGHILAAYFDVHGSANRSAIISCRYKDPALKTAHGEKARRRLIGSGDIGRIACAPKRQNKATTSGIIMISEVDGTYPDWTRVIPDFEGKAPKVASWSPVVINRVMAIARRFHGNALTMSTVQQAGQGEPAVFTFGRASGLYIIAMPMRGDDPSMIATESVSGKCLASVDAGMPEFFSEFHPA